MEGVIDDYFGRVAQGGPRQGKAQAMVLPGTGGGPEDAGLFGSSTTIKAVIIIAVVAAIYYFIYRK